jgi:hypothetical protein
MRAHWKKSRSALSTERMLELDSEAPQVGSARSDSTRFVKVNHRKTNHCKTRPYCIKPAHKMYHLSSTLYQNLPQHSKLS